MKKKTTTTADFRRKLQKHVDAIAKHRDEMRNLIEESSDVVDCCDEAIALANDAVERLSEHV